MSEKYDKLDSKLIRKDILYLSHLANSSHIGSSLSIVEILLAVYKFFIGTKLKKKNFTDFTFILSKGHACLALYCVLCKFGFISRKTLYTYGKKNSILMQHASHKVPGIKVSTGSLGHGLPIGAGIALSAKLSKKNKKVVVLISDGELDEGSTWESILFASHHRLKNLIIIIDYNKLQSLTLVKDTLAVEPLAEKFKAFGCNTKVVNGHDITRIKKLISLNVSNKPLVIIANTIKGKGISFMENKISWHYKSPNKDELNLALKELI